MTANIYLGSNQAAFDSGKKWELCIADPPFGIGASEMKMGKGKNQKWKTGKKWDSAIPDKTYFNNLFACTERQIIFGGNYFSLPLTGGWLFWDKMKGKDISFADGELAWTSFLTVLKKVEFRYDGFIGADTDRIHNTQKPVPLYKKLLKNYAKQCDKILDPFGGSMSSVIACIDMGFDIDCYEKDEDYYFAAKKRILNHIQQLPLFGAPPIINFHE